MLVSFHCNSLITVNDTEIFVCINDTPLLNVTFLYVSKYTTDNIFSRNFCPQERKFQGTKVPWNFHSRERKFPGTKVPRNESSTIWNFRSRGRTFHGIEVRILVTFHYSLLLGTLLASIRYSVFVTLLVTELSLLQRYSGTLQHANCYCTTAVSSND